MNFALSIVHPYLCVHTAIMGDDIPPLILYSLRLNRYCSTHPVHRVEICLDPFQFLQIRETSLETGTCLPLWHRLEKRVFLFKHFQVNGTSSSLWENTMLATSLKAEHTSAGRILINTVCGWKILFPVFPIWITAGEHQLASWLLRAVILKHFSFWLNYSVGQTEKFMSWNWVNFSGRTQGLTSFDTKQNVFQT